MKFDALVVPVFLILFTAAVSFLVALYWAKRKDAAERLVMIGVKEKRLQDEIDGLKEQVGLLSKELQPISAAFLAVLIKNLTHYHTPVLDALLAKLGPPCTLTDAEENEMYAALDERTRTLDGAIDEWEKLDAELLPLVLQRVKHDSMPEVDSTSRMTLVGIPETGFTISKPGELGK